MTRKKFYQKLKVTKTDWALFDKAPVLARIQDGVITKPENGMSYLQWYRGINI